MTKFYREKIASMEKAVRKWPAVEIVWMDACSSSTRYHTIQELIDEGNEGAMVRTIGALVRETPEFYQVAQCNSEFAEAWFPLDIPKAWVLRKRRLAPRGTK